MPPHADVLQWEHLPFPKSLRDFQRLFKDDAACARYLEGAKWPKGFVCPHSVLRSIPAKGTVQMTISKALASLAVAVWDNWDDNHLASNFDLMEKIAQFAAGYDVDKP